MGTAGVFILIKRCLKHIVPLRSVTDSGSKEQSWGGEERGDWQTWSHCSVWISDCWNHSMVSGCFCSVSVFDCYKHIYYSQSFCFIGLCPKLFGIARAQFYAFPNLNCQWLISLMYWCTLFSYENLGSAAWEFSWKCETLRCENSML